MPARRPGPLNPRRPEGGFIPVEVVRLRELGTLFELGPRILRAETAIVALLARLS